MSRDRAFRRSQETKRKKQARRVMRENWNYRDEDMTDAAVGRTARSPKQCGGACCGNPRRYRSEKTRQEEISELDEEEQIRRALARRGREAFWRENETPEDNDNGPVA